MDEQSYDLCKRFADRCLDPVRALEIADLGSFDVNGTFKEIFNRPNWTYKGLDIIPGPNVDIVLKDEYHWGIFDKYDVVISGNTIEHVKKPWDWMISISDLCRRNALIWVEVPNEWPYHPYPVDCWRIWPEGLKALFEHANIMPVVLEIEGPFTIGIGRKT